MSQVFSWLAEFYLTMDPKHGVSLPHVTFEWQKKQADLNRKCGAVCNYFATRFYAAPSECVIPPGGHMYVHFGDRGDGEPAGYSMYRTVHNHVYPLHHVEMTVALGNTNENEPFVIAAGTPLNQLANHAQLYCCFAVLPAPNQTSALSEFDFM